MKCQSQSWQADRSACIVCHTCQNYPPDETDYHWQSVCTDPAYSFLRKVTPMNFRNAKSFRHCTCHKIYPGYYKKVHPLYYTYLKLNCKHYMVSAVVNRMVRLNTCTFKIDSQWLGNSKGVKKVQSYPAIYT